MERLVGLLSHENVDIVIDVVEVVNEFTDEDVGNEIEEDNERGQKALQQLIEAFVRIIHNADITCSSASRLQTLFSNCWLITLAVSTKLRNLIGKASSTCSASSRKMVIYPVHPAEVAQVYLRMFLDSTQTSLRRWLQELRSWSGY